MKNKSGKSNYLFIVFFFVILALLFFLLNLTGFDNYIQNKFFLKDDLLAKNGYHNVFFNFYIELGIFFIFIVFTYLINLKKGFIYIVYNTFITFSLVSIYFYYINQNELVLSFPGELILSIIFTIIYVNYIKYFYEYRMFSKLNKALSEYVSKDITNEIISGEGSINLGGEKKTIVTFFSDIEGFTTISEKYKPEDLIKYLKEYISSMSEIIIKNNGFINKYEGDAILALWGVFGNIEEDQIVKSACDTALEQLEYIKELNSKWKSNKFKKLNIRIGLNIGSAILGNIGLEGQKVEFTAIGDSVNLASRLEEINKYYGTNICVSENIYKHVKKYYEFRFLDKIKVKGKTKSVDIYELIDYKHKLSPDKKAYIDDFEKAVSLYQKTKFKDALKQFKKISANGGKDVKLYIERCEYFIKNPPKKDWDGTWTMISK